MYNSNLYVEEDLEFQRLLQKRYLQQLRGLPAGGLSTTIIKNQTYYYKVLNGKKTYIGKADSKEVLQLQKRKFIEASLKRIEQNCVLMEQLIEGYKGIDPEEVMSNETRAYRTPPQCCFSMSGVHNGKKWGNKPYRKFKGFPEGLKHKTLKGEQVRSKSEALIANMLFVKKIEYHYEEEIDIGGKTIPPDFKIFVKSQNKFKLLEHLGMLVKEKYRSDALAKMDFYFSNGYRLYDDILFTCDDLAGRINTQDIGKLINDYCV